MYCTIDDLRKQSSEDFLIKCTDDAGTDTVDVGIVEEKINDAQMEIDSYCRNQYSVPFQTAPGLIRKLAVDISLYNLLSRRGYEEDSPDAIIVKRYRDAVKLLENLSKGIVTIGDSAGHAVPQPQQTVIQSSPRLFSRDRMRGY